MKEERYLSGVRAIRPRTIFIVVVRRGSSFQRLIFLKEESGHRSGFYIASLLPIHAFNMSRLWRVWLQPSESIHGTAGLGFEKDGTELFRVFFAPSGRNFETQRGPDSSNFISPVRTSFNNVRNTDAASNGDFATHRSTFLMRNGVVCRQCLASH
jgi:hypothetical protein